MLQSDKSPAATGEWECMECGHILEGTELQRPDHCPECNAPADAFEFFSYEEEEWEGDLEDDDEEDDEMDDEPDEFEDLDEEDEEEYEDFEDEDDDR